MFVFYTLIFCRVTIGIVFALSFLGKVRDIRLFAQVIAKFKVMPAWFSYAAAWGITCCESAIVLLMIIGGSWLRIGFILAAVLLLIFSIVLAFALNRGLQTPCNCFGAMTKPISKADLWRNAGLIFFALCGWTALIVSQGKPVAFRPIEGVIISLAAILFVTIWLQLGEIIQFLRVR